MQPLLPMNAHLPSIGRCRTTNKHRDQFVMDGENFDSFACVADMGVLFSLATPNKTKFKWTMTRSMKANNVLGYSPYDIKRWTCYKNFEKFKGSKRLIDYMKVNTVRFYECKTIDQYVSRLIDSYIHWSVAHKPIVNLR